MNTRLLLRIFFRTYLVGATFNAKGMQNVGLAYIMDPALIRLYGADPTVLQRARTRYLKHYNTHPFWTPLLTGIFLSLEKRIAQGLLSVDIFPKLITTTVYTLSALGDSFFGGSFLVTWSLVAVNLAVSDRLGWLALWIILCLAGLFAFRLYTFGRGYSRGLAFLQSLKAWNLMAWGQRLKMVNGVLTAFFVLQIVPNPGPWSLAWVGGAAGLAVCSLWRSFVRSLLLAVLALLALVIPGESIRAFVFM